MTSLGGASLRALRACDCAVDGIDLGGQALAGEQLRRAAPGGESPGGAAFGVVEQDPPRAAEALCVLRDQPARLAVGDDLGQRTATAGDRRDATGLGLEQRPATAVRAGHEEGEQVDAAEHVPVIFSAVAREDDTICDAELRRRAPGDLVDVGAAADDQQARQRVVLREAAHGFEQQVEAAVALHPGHDPDHVMLRREPQPRPDVGIGRSRCEVLDVHGAEQARHRTTTQRRVGLGGSTRGQQQSIGGPPEEPAIPGPARDALGPRKRTHEPRLRTRGPPTEDVIAGVPGVDDVGPRAGPPAAQLRQVGSIAPRVRPPGARETQRGLDSRIARAIGQTPLPGRRLGTREQRFVAGRPLGEQQLEHRLGRPGPLPVAEQVQDLQVAARRRGDPEGPLTCAGARPSSHP